MSGLTLRMETDCNLTTDLRSTLKRKYNEDEYSKFREAYGHFQSSENSKKSRLTRKSFEQSLTGSPGVLQQFISSPFTHRVLPPYIRQDYSIEPLKLKLLREIENRGAASPRPKYPINFTYIHQKQVNAVNRLARSFFWPGIDVSETLKYPDFSCVASYKELVVGFAFLVPDFSHQEAYITYIFTHPEWRRVGIAKFMLYHLIQTCMGKDIILHVSANNPAIFLYLKFGFKIEELVLNFYEHYNREITASKHAFYLRLSR